VSTSSAGSAAGLVGRVAAGAAWCGRADGRDGLRARGAPESAGGGAAGDGAKPELRTICRQGRGEARLCWAQARKRSRRVAGRTASSRAEPGRSRRRVSVEQPDHDGPQPLLVRCLLARAYTRLLLFMRAGCCCR
jgi:hypothetical protein